MRSTAGQKKTGTGYSKLCNSLRQFSHRTAAFHTEHCTSLSTL